MALLFYDGFDAYESVSDMPTPTYTVGSLAVVSGGGRYGGNALKDNNTTSYVNLSGSSEIWHGRAVLVSSTVPDIVQFMDTSGSQIVLIQMASNGALKVNVGGTVVATSAIGALGTGIWHWLEFHVKNGSSGIVEVWVDGVQVIDYSGSLSTNSIGQVAIAFGDGAQYLVDDIYILDTTGSAPLNTRLGDCRIAMAVPNADAGPNNGVPASGTSHYPMVDQALGYNSADYLTITNTSGQEELFDVGSLPSTPSTVFAVGVVATAEKSDSGLAFGEVLLISSGSQDTSSSFPLLTSYQANRAFWTVDPHTSAAWTNTAVSSVQIGYKVP